MNILIDSKTIAAIAAHLSSKTPHFHAYMVEDAIRRALWLCRLPSEIQIGKADITEIAKAIRAIPRHVPTPSHALILSSIAAATGFSSTRAMIAMLKRASSQGIERACAPSTVVSYMYRDASNYKTSSKIVLAGRITVDDERRYRSNLVDGGDFIPGQIGLSDLQDSFFGCDSYWDPDLDHPYHELTGIEPSEARPTVAMSAAEFVHLLATTSWDDTYLPPFHHEMRERFENRTDTEATDLIEAHGTAGDLPTEEGPGEEKDD